MACLWINYVHLFRCHKVICREVDMWRTDIIHQAHSHYQRRLYHWRQVFNIKIAESIESPVPRQCFPVLNEVNEFICRPCCHPEIVPEIGEEWDLWCAYCYPVSIKCCSGDGKCAPWLAPSTAIRDTSTSGLEQRKSIPLTQSI